MVDALVRPGDAGANWELYAARLAHLVGAEGQVDAFEPHPAHGRPLHALANRRPQLAVHKLALYSTPDSATLYVPIVGARRITALASLRPPPSGVAHELLVVPVGTLELAVLRGAEGRLRAARLTLLVEIEQCHQRAPIADTFAYPQALGYTGFFFVPDGLTPLARFDVERDEVRHLRQASPKRGMPDDLRIGQKCVRTLSRRTTQLLGSVPPPRSRSRAPLDHGRKNSSRYGSPCAAAPASAARSG